VKNFIILFEEKEGTSPLMRLLDNFGDTTIVHQVNNKGWEPFETHNCGRMPNDSLRKCLELLYGNNYVDIAAVNSVYAKTASRPLCEIGDRDILGFKMRFRPLGLSPLEVIKFSRWNDVTRKITNEYMNKKFKRMMIDIFREHEVTVFFAVRQDLLRWGLSKYHGDGAGRRGHLQFKLATGRIKEKDIQSIRVNLRKLDKIIQHCSYVHREKKQLMAEMSSQGVHCSVLRYEDFLDDTLSYFKNFFAQLGVEKAEEDIRIAMAKGAYFRKVHKQDIASFVVNHEEVLRKYGNEYAEF